jgi:hypothetical protein
MPHNGCGGVFGASRTPRSYDRARWELGGNRADQTLFEMPVSERGKEAQSWLEREVPSLWRLHICWLGWIRHESIP